VKCELCGRGYDLVIFTSDEWTEPKTICRTCVSVIRWTDGEETDD
jgi:hypothetical protein